MYKLEQFTGSEAEEYALEQEKKNKKQFKTMRIGCNFLSIFLLIVLTYINPDNFIWFFLIYGLGTGVMGNWVISHVKKIQMRKTQEISEGKSQYVCVDGLECNVNLKFETVEGEIVEKIFPKDAYGKYRKAKSVYIIYIPAINRWDVENKTVIE